MLVVKNEPGATRTRYGAYLQLLQGKQSANRVYLISAAVMVVASWSWLVGLLFYSSVQELLPWIVTIASTSMCFVAGICRQLLSSKLIFLPGDTEGRLTPALAAVYIILSLLVVSLIVKQGRESQINAVRPRQVVEIELCSPTDFSDQKQVLPGTVKLDSLRRRKSPDRVSRQGQKIPAVAKSTPAKKQAIEQHSARGATVAKPEPLASNSRVALVPVKPAALLRPSQQLAAQQVLKLPVLPGWKTVTMDSSRRLPAVASAKQQPFMQEVAAPELMELVNNDGDHSLNLWQEGGSSKGGAGKRNGLAEYLKLLNRRIKAVWSPPRGETRSAEILFRIDRQGKLLSVQLVRTSGSAAADKAALEAVAAAAPFKRLPNDYPLDYIDIQYNFNYSVNQLEEINHLSAE